MLVLKATHDGTMFWDDMHHDYVDYYDILGLIQEGIKFKIVDLNNKDQTETVIKKILQFIDLKTVKFHTIDI